MRERWGGGGIGGEEEKTDKGREEDSLNRVEEGYAVLFLLSRDFAARFLRVEC